MCTIIALGTEEIVSGRDKPQITLFSLETPFSKVTSVHRLYASLNLKVFFERSLMNNSFST